MRSKPERPIVTYDMPGKPLAVREILKGKYEDFRHRNFQEPHRRSYFSFFLIRTGFIRHSVDFNSYHCKAHDAFFIMPHQAYFVETAGNISVIGVVASPEILTVEESELPIIQNLQTNNRLKLSPAQYRYADSLFKLMLAEYNKDEILSDPLLRSYLTTLLIYLSRIYIQQNKTASAITAINPVVQKFRMLLSANWNKQWNVSAYARQLHITTGHLNKIIKQQSGKNAGEWLRDKKMLEIKRLLLHSENSIKQIAYETGFDDPAYFNRFFKSNAGKTPLHFKVEMLKKYNTMH